MPPAIDVEISNDQTPQVVADRLFDMVVKMQQHLGFLPMIYTSPGVWSKIVDPKHDDLFSKCLLWVAHWGVDTPQLARGWNDYIIHQYTSSGTVAGYAKNIDRDRVKAKSESFHLSWPVAEPVIIQEFGVNRTGIPDFYSKFKLPAHEGLDFDAPPKTPIFSCADGIVNRIELISPRPPTSGWPYGIQIRITSTDANGQVYEAIYAHLFEVDVKMKVGESVARGQQIGLSDNTGNSRGNHLHLTLKKRGATERGELQKLGDGRLVVYPSDLVDPAPYFS